MKLQKLVTRDVIVANIIWFFLNLFFKTSEITNPIVAPKTIGKNATETNITPIIDPDSVDPNEAM